MKNNEEHLSLKTQSDESNNHITAYFFLLFGLVAYYLNTQPISVFHYFNGNMSVYIIIHLSLYSISFLSLISPFLLVKNKWSDIIIDILVVIILVLSVQHYTKVSISPNSILNFDRYQTQTFEKAIIS